MMNHPICDEPRQRGPDFSKALRHRPSSDSFERACSFAPTHAPPSFPEHSPASIIARALTPSARNPIFVTTNGVAMRWTWDPDKAAANRVKHGLSFETAVLVFDDPLHASKPDPHPDGNRCHTIGLVGPVLLLVIHTWPEETEEGEPVGRIISARKATAHERRAYEEGSF